MTFKESELILNSDSSIYHLNLKPENIAETIIFVGDQDRVEKVTKHFNSIEFETQKREFKTQTGYYKGKRLTVISTGIGTDNIDIVLNELDALVNIDLKTRKLKVSHTSLNIIRIGTSGSLQSYIPIDSFVISSQAVDINGMLHSYQIESIRQRPIENEFIKHTNWSNENSKPIFIEGDKDLLRKFSNDKIFNGVTITAGGFYGPQGRVLRLPLEDNLLNSKINSFEFNELKITNFEMETSGIYGLSKLLGHKAISLNAIIANRANGTFSEKPYEIIENLIKYTLNKIVE